MQRALATAGGATIEALTSGVREAQGTLISASTDAASQIKSLTTDI